MTPIRITVAGAGSWGTALAVVLARNGHVVRLWDRNPQHCATLAAERENRHYLPTVVFPAGLTVTPQLETAVAACDHVLIVIPTTGFRPLLARLRTCLEEGVGVSWGSKGLEQHSHLLLHQVAHQELGEQHPLAVISGPTFAREVAIGLPAALTVSAPDLAFAETVAGWLRNETLRVYPGTDWVGVQIGAAAKNVIAIATGIADGLGFGANTRAALVTRGLHEIMRLGVALGGKPETFMGLAGLGDLTLTCTDDQSRNRRFGQALGAGMAVEAALASIGQVVEGYHAAAQIVALAQQHGIEMPISQEVYRVVYEQASPVEAVRRLLAREPKPEIS